MGVNLNKWFEIVKNAIEASTNDYVISWHLARDSNLKTSQVNYRLNLLVKQGLLRKETNVYCSKYYLVS